MNLVFQIALNFFGPIINSLGIFVVVDGIPKQINKTFILVDNQVKEVTIYSLVDNIVKVI